MTDLEYYNLNGKCTAQKDHLCRCFEQDPFNRRYQICFYRNENGHCLHAAEINIIHGDCMEEWFDNPKTNEDKFLKALSICGDIPDPNGEYESLFFRLYDEIEPLIKRNEQ